MEHACRWNGDGDVIRAIEIGELAFTELYANDTSVQQPAHEVVDWGYIEFGVVRIHSAIVV